MDIWVNRGGIAVSESGVTSSLEDLADQVSDGRVQIVELSDYIPSSPAVIQSAKETIINEINDKKHSLSVANIITAKGEFQADEKSQINILATYARASRIGAGFTINWIDHENNIVLLSQSDVFDLGDSLMDREAAAIYNANTQKAEVNALTDYSDIIAYVV